MNLVRVILVRHGETDWNQSRRIQGGGSDTPLNEKGKEQAESLASRLKSESIQAIYSSPLQRARDTAQAIAGYHQLEVGIEPSLKEIEVGELEGTPIAEIGKHLDQLLTADSHGEIMPRMPGGESVTEVQQRAWSTIKRLVDKHPDGVLVAVCHYFVISTIICSVLNLPLSRMGRFRIGVGSISAITFEPRAARLALFNDRCHLMDG